MLDFMFDVPTTCDTMLFTVRKRSLGQDNVSTSVCHSVNWREGVGFPACITGHMTNGRGSASEGGSTFREGGGSASRGRGVCIWGRGWADPPRDGWDTTRYGQQAGSMHPTGMHSCLKTFCWYIPVCIAIIFC